MSIERISVENKQELERMITKEMGQIEKGLTVICTRVPVNDKTTLDILCHDSNGQLVVIQLNVKEDNNMLIQGMQSLEYVNRFKSFLKATYHKHKIDDKEKPRLIMIAPSFSETLRRVVENIQGIRIDLYEWEYLKLGDHKGLKLQPIFVRKPVEKPKEKREEAKPAEKKKEPKPTKKKEEPELPKEEIPEPPPPEKPKVEPEEPKPEEKEEPPKRKLRLF